MKNRLTIIVVSIVLTLGIASAGTAWYTTSHRQQPVAAASQSVPQKQNQLTYRGKDGTTALALLQQHTKVALKGSGDLAFVTSINGLKADDSKKQYWSLLVNGQASNVGAGSLITKNSDSITWKLTTY